MAPVAKFHTTQFKEQRNTSSRGKANMRSINTKFVLLEQGIKKTKDGQRVVVMHEVYSDSDNDSVLQQEDQDATLSNNASSTSSPPATKRVNNSFFLYRSDPLVKLRHMTKSGSRRESQIVQDMSTEWNALSAAEKLPYQLQAEKASEAHKRLLNRRSRYKPRTHGEQSAINQQQLNLVPLTDWQVPRGLTESLQSGTTAGTLLSVSASEDVFDVHDTTYIDYYEHLNALPHTTFSYVPTATDWFSHDRVERTLIPYTDASRMSSQYWQHPYQCTIHQG